jgi:hypothetical protein
MSMVKSKYMLQEGFATSATYFERSSWSKSDPVTYSVNGLCEISNPFCKNKG